MLVKSFGITSRALTLPKFFLDHCLGLPTLNQVGYGDQTVYKDLGILGCAQLSSFSRRAQLTRTYTYIYYMGVSENSVPLNPMVNDHYPY